MKNNLKEKLEKLNVTFNNDLDIISLKALCTVEENEQTKYAIKEIIERLRKKYPTNQQIKELLLDEKKFSIEELIKILERKYSKDVEITIIKALYNLSESKEKENAIKQSLERLLKKNSNDNDIINYLKNDKKLLIEEKKEKRIETNMIFVEEGIYQPSFFDEERTTFDLYVGKYDVTNDEWDELMDINPSKILGARKPVNNVSRIQVFEFCNRMSIKYGLQPVYKIENDKLIKIIYKDGREEYPNLADFSKTEGYRLPTEIEWEWFAWGGKIAQKQGKFNKKISPTEESIQRNDAMSRLGTCGIFMSGLASLADKIPDYSDVAWYGETQIHDVGLKKPNELGLYDIIGNVEQHIYDTALDGYIDEKRAYIYDENYSGRLRGGSCKNQIGNKLGGGHLYEKRDSSAFLGLPNIENVGFRVVRTANPEK